MGMTNFFTVCLSVARLKMSESDTKNVLSMNSMFSGATSLVSVDV